MARNIVKTECGDCLDPIVVDLSLDVFEVRATMPSNGKRGAGHVPAHKVTGPVMVEADGMLALFDCPLCGYADSVYATEALRKELS